ncbi:MAG: ABC transporter ATP-binding protein [Candidatus Kapabacteria bacterium]|nr:ABC transporter ATP-binding protein [Candidatus Kapabacteria bacterium]
MPLISACELFKSYRRAGQADTDVLRGASLHVEPGEVIALVGPSGAGKSTMLHIMASLDNADKGKVEMLLNGRMTDLALLSASALASVRAKHIGMVFQFHHLLPEFSAIENVAMPALVAGSSTLDAHRRARVLLEQVGMTHRADHLPLEMSGGEQQRVAIARALINDPSIVFADEPTGNLDTENAESVADLLIGLRAAKNVACVIATHSEDLAHRAHRVVHMVDGRCTGSENA